MYRITMKVDTQVKYFRVGTELTHLISELFVSRSDYCYTMWSAIGIILSSVRPSVCLWRCALWLSGSVYRA